ncbi:ATP-dependent DNA helicase RecG [Spongisporangium articulatum]|uniref:Probable DNA 3'-5' helicase RecG n=1 Tax=Spongisporangium articulatum TaxID=3362603 RepID=A0ABW8AP65_9ACTN
MTPTDPTDPSDPADQLALPLKRSVAAGSAAKLEKSLGLHTVGDLLRHYPRRYLKLNELTRVADLPLEQLVTMVGEVERVDVRQMQSRRGKIMNVVVGDADGQRLNLTFFNRIHYYERVLKPGVRGVFTGKVSVYRGNRQLAQPTFQAIEDTFGETWREGVPLNQVLPVYPASEKGGLDSGAIQRTVALVLDGLTELPDPIPADVRARHGLVGLREAFELVHRPPSIEAAYEQGLHRLRFEEAYVMQAALARRRVVDGAQPAVPRRAVAGGLVEALDAKLPFALTTGQAEIGATIAADLAEAHPMHRLLQGEVGSGKTLVALRAMLAVVDAGGQAALLAPTEVLAAQHHRSISGLLGDLALGGLAGLGTRVTLLTGSLNAASRRRALLEAASGEAGIVVGTHALLADKVQFADLGLVVVDEQHRFGVEQRDALRGKGSGDDPAVPHLLVMTATPIPRTVAMTVFGDLEVSSLTELPKGRAPIATHVVPEGDRRWVGRVWQRVAEEAGQGHQAFVVCPRIGEDEGPDDPDDADELEPVAEDPGGAAARRPARGCVAVLAELRERPELAGLSIELLHGRMAAEARDDVMRRFAAGQVDVLVATTVIEVGVDVPNATVMVVVDADRFGVSQLHQLRGRIGRGSAPGLALLITEVDEGPARERLDAVAATTDGFELARVDLEQRREGDVLGNRQSGGRSSLRLLRVLRDEKLIEEARHEAVAVVGADPELRGQPELRDAMQVWLDAEREIYLERG